MKKFADQLIKLIAVSGLVASLAACGTATKEEAPAAAEETPDPKPAEVVSQLTDAGTYKALGMSLDDYIVESDSLNGYTIELAEDGTGYLNFGADNQGPISSWDNSGTFTMKAGVSDFTGTLKDGVLYLDLGDNIVLCFAQDEADVSKLEVITMDAYKKLKDAVSEAAGATGVAGEYKIYALESQGQCISIPEGEMEFTVKLSEDGTASVTVDGESEALTWKMDDKTLTLLDANGNVSGAEYTITVENGIMTFYVPGKNGEPDIYEYLVTKDADVSSLNAGPASELQKAE
ncbi:MAG: hypothetical protein J6S26_01625 [Solobacterium sp.]|nr:hypothetical protein [Solobacterium sp.]